MTRIAILFAMAGLLSVAGSIAGATADTIEIEPVKDNTLYQPISDEINSNGMGEHIFAGRVAAAARRCALIAFDVANNVPAGATIEGASLRLHMSRTIAGPTSVSLHLLLEDWGEGSTNAVGNEGFGDAASPGDATWFDQFFPSDPWATVGGTFATFASGTITVNAVGFYTWDSNPNLVANVQSWLDNPAANFGWVVVGQETSFPSAKRFDSRSFNEDPQRRPRLTVTFTPGECLDGDEDGYGDPGSSACPNGPQQDCNDANAAINPGATEIWYDGVDQNCDNLDDFDQDQDGFACDPVSGRNNCPTSVGDDCDDTAPSANPGAAEVCDFIDNDCNGEVDELPNCAIPTVSLWGMIVMCLTLLLVAAWVFRRGLN